LVGPARAVQRCRSGHYSNRLGLHKNTQNAQSRTLYHLTRQRIGSSETFLARPACGIRIARCPSRRAGLHATF
jgi:hypothetical protein